MAKRSIEEILKAARQGADAPAGPVPAAPKVEPKATPPEAADAPQGPRAARPLSVAEKIAAAQASGAGRPVAAPGRSPDRTDKANKSQADGARTPRAGDKAKAAPRPKAVAQTEESEDPRVPAPASPEQAVPVPPRSWLLSLAILAIGWVSAGLILAGLIWYFAPALVPEIPGRTVSTGPATPSLTRGDG